MTQRPDLFQPVRFLADAFVDVRQFSGDFGVAAEVFACLIEFHTRLGQAFFGVAY